MKTTRRARRNGEISAANCILPKKEGPPPKLYINGRDAVIESLKVRELESIWHKTGKTKARKK